MPITPDEARKEVQSILVKKNKTGFCNNVNGKLDVTLYNSVMQELGTKYQEHLIVPMFVSLKAKIFTDANAIWDGAARSILFPLKRTILEEIFSGNGGNISGNIPVLSFQLEDWGEKGKQFWSRGAFETSLYLTGIFNTIFTPKSGENIFANEENLKDAIRLAVEPLVTTITAGR